jgi:RimJ/RimL family protein N-acetyltransferase
MIVEPVVLEGSLVRLEPLAQRHLADLTEVAADQGVWRWMPQDESTPERMQVWLDEAIVAAATGVQSPFATIERATGRAVGSTRYLAVEPAHRRLEIGWTWLAASARGRGINDEAKLLQMRHAFEVLGCRRVEFKTDSRNERSRRALTGIGGTFEGIHRKHMIVHGDRTRHSAWYSVIDDEWPEVRRRLETRLSRHLNEAGQARTTTP